MTKSGTSQKERWSHKIYAGETCRVGKVAQMCHVSYFFQLSPTQRALASSFC